MDEVKRNPSHWSKMVLPALLVAMNCGSAPALRAEETTAEISATCAASFAEKTAEEKATQSEEPGSLGGISWGPWRLGGALRGNYTYGDYPGAAGPSRGSRGGNFELDTFRLNLDAARDGWISSAEYRWYDGYNFIHHLWAGYADAVDRVEVGVTRAPFGPGDYGVSRSWFFDQHYYVGLADDMDLGVKYTRQAGDWTLDVAYFARSEWDGNGASRDSARYSYDVVKTDTGGFSEEHQFNLRAIRHWHGEEWSVDVGASGRFGMLDGPGGEGGHHYAASLHAVAKRGNWTLAVQATRYEYSLPNDADLVPMGAYDYAADVAARAWVVAASLSYHLETPDVSFLDYVVPYVEYSSIIKDEHGFNNSDMLVVGAAWASGGWYIYTDVAFSDGNFFVGNKGDFGANADDGWQYRININLGYYF